MRHPGKKTESRHKAGYIAIIGAPNAGKSTLLNRFMGEKLAIVAAKPQTTRHKVLGVLTEPGRQLVFWDTPGYHLSDKLLNREMGKRSLAAMADSDVVLWLVDPRHRGREHDCVRDLILNSRKDNLVAVVGKADLVPAGEAEALAAALREEFGFEEVHRVSAKTGEGLDKLKNALISRLPESPPLFPGDTLTDQPMRLIAAEYVREAVFRLTNDELPYSTAVTIDEYVEGNPAGPGPGNKTYIGATIHVEKENQKMIMIGSKGAMLSEIGIRARQSIERMLGKPVYLKLFVRLSKDWSKKKNSIRDFGYGD
ncbi:MAG: GTPase Era [Deltaproteobacteria bacterium]|jgi:GTP-binding protein Era|nr:GTPase Era [Deltaproteobacteria bacterium]